MLQYRSSEKTGILLVFSLADSQDFLFSLTDQLRVLSLTDYQVSVPFYLDPIQTICLKSGSNAEISC